MSHQFSRLERPRRTHEEPTKNPRRTLSPPGRFTPDPATFEGLFDYADAFLDDTVLGVEAIIDVLAPGTSIFSHFFESLSLVIPVLDSL
jgi:hypothetical protein